ncbi:MAG TPA: CPXCG motif-containing cysteine-rich protein [Phycisphaerae bacterium]|nr:CPXCG motif-containing cysteine-rich protein [Phycisphaerae bacterium]
MIGDEASYVCSTCGEDIVIPVDPSAGSDQTYTEDCPVCCHPNIIHVVYDPDTGPQIWSEGE